MPTIRSALPADVDAIAPLFDAYRQFFTEASQLSASREFLAQRLERAESVVLAAFENARVVGFLQLYPLFSSWYLRRQWFLSDLYVDPEFRERGLGQRLVAAAVDYAGESDARAILVELPFSEPHLTRFYSRLGFEKDAVFELYRRTLR